MRQAHFIRALVLLAILITNISCDQVSKSIVRQHVLDHERISLVHETLTLTRVENTGAFLSLGSALPYAARLLLLTILPTVVIGFAIFYLLTTTTLSRTSGIAISFIAGGGVGNLYDRIMYGSVTDFLHLNFGIVQTGIFNLADVSIVIGVMIIAFHSRFRSVAHSANVGQRNGRCGN